MSKLTPDQFKKLKELLSTAKESTAEEFEELNRATDGVYGKYLNQDMEHDNSEGGADKHVTSTKITSYSLKNTELKNFVSRYSKKILTQLILYILAIMELEIQLLHIMMYQHLLLS
jgi:hypothetical protein